MLKVDLTERPGNLKDRLGYLVACLVRGLLVFLIGTSLLAALGTLMGGAPHLVYLATRATVFDTWGALSIIAVLLSVTAIAGAGFALRRRKLILALGFAVIAAPTQFVIEGSRCDTAEACRMMGWAALPSRAFAWGVRLRPVTDANEAEAIASAALSQAGSSDSTFKAKRFGDHWIVSSIDQDGWPGDHAVRIDTRSGKTKLVACPADKVQCGMERPTVSDGQRAFRNSGLGLVAIFPASRPVCTSRGTDDAPRGFFSIVRSPDIPCEILDGSRQMGVEVAQSQKNGCTSVEAPSVPWRPLSIETARLFRNSTPTFGGKLSVACELKDGDQIQVSVYAPTPFRSTLGRSPGPLYEAYIVTTPAQLAEDVRAFEAFLEGVRTDSPNGERTD